MKGKTPSTENCAIVVSMYNARRGIIALLDNLFFPSLLRNASSDKQLVLLDDASPLQKETESVVSKYRPDLIRSFGDVRFVRNSVNLGFGRSYNKGMRLADGAHLIITNDDVYLPVGSLDSLREKLAEPLAGLVGPVTNAAASYQNTRIFRGIRNYSQPELQRIEDCAQMLRNCVGRRVIAVRRLVAFCLAIEASLVREIGYLDESFIHGFWEDDDYCIRTRKAGFQILLDASTFVAHGGPLGASMSFRQDIPRYLKYLLSNGSRLVKKHDLTLREVFLERIEIGLQLCFDRRTVTGELRKHLQNAGLPGSA